MRTPEPIAPVNQTDPTLPRWMWWGVRGGVLLVIVVVVLAAVFIERGAADPPVAGPVSWADNDLFWADGPNVTLAAGTEVWWTAPPTLPDAGVFTLDVRAILAVDADPLAAWGVWVGDRYGGRTLYAVSAGGYWTIRLCAADDFPPPAIETCPARHPDWRWSPFPRIAAPGEANTLTLHREPGGVLRLRINQERLGAPVVAVLGGWGVWARGGDQEAALTWKRAALALDE